MEQSTTISDNISDEEDPKLKYEASINEETINQQSKDDNYQLKITGFHPSNQPYQEQ